MPLEPKIIEVPGIPGKLQEQTLDQFLSVLAPDHLARKQLDEIRNQALRSVELSTQLMQANDRVLALQAQLMKPAPELHAPQNKYVPAPDLVALNPVAEPAPPAEKAPAYPKKECPVCHAQVSTMPGPWAAHQKKHQTA